MRLPALASRSITCCRDALDLPRARGTRRLLGTVTQAFPASIQSFLQPPELAHSSLFLRIVIAECCQLQLKKMSLTAIVQECARTPHELGCFG